MEVANIYKYHGKNVFFSIHFCSIHFCILMCFRIDHYKFINQEFWGTIDWTPSFFEASKFVGGLLTSISAMIKSQIYIDSIHFFICNNFFETVKFNWSSIQTSCIPCWLCILVDVLVSDVSKNPKKNHHPSTGGYKHINIYKPLYGWFYTHKVPTFHGILQFYSCPGRCF